MGELIKISFEHSRIISPDLDPNGILKTGDAAWVCNCGSVLFFLTPNGAKCSECGTISSDWAE